VGDSAREISPTAPRILTAATSAQPPATIVRAACHRSSLSLLRNRYRSDVSTPKSLVADVEECRNAHDRLIAGIVDLSDEQVAQPSRLPDWTRAHVLSHLASNADSVLRRLSAAREGHLVDQYAGGAEGRRDEIERGSMRPAAELVDLVRPTAKEVDELFASFPEEAWERPIRAVDGPDRPARLAVFSRWREVEAHHVDLDIGYNVEDWPQTLVDRWLPSTVEGLAGRTDRNELLGWLLGRGPAPLLRPWG